MMFLVAVLCAGAAVTLCGIVLNFSALSSTKSFLLSVLVVFICSFALQARQAAARKGTSRLGTWLASFVSIFVLSPAAMPYLALWRAARGFWPVVFLLWLALLALVTISIPVEGGKT
jgi:hypothetical protein